MGSIIEEQACSGTNTHTDRHSSGGHSNKIRRWKTALAAMLLALVLPMQVLAATPAVPDLAKDSKGNLASGSISIYFAHEGTVLSGATFAAYKVADLSVNGGSPSYTLVGDFSNAGISFNGMTEAQSKEAAKKLDGLVKSSTTVTAQTTGTDGIAQFSNLSPGMYLIKQTGRIGQASLYSMADSFLVAMPQYNSKDGKWNYVVTAYPKSSVYKEPVVEPQKEVPPTEIPQPSVVTPPATPETPVVPETTVQNPPILTGDYFNLPVLIGIAGAIVAAIAVVLIVKKEKQNKKRV